MQELIRQGKLNIENVDVFCEKGVYNVDQTRRILKEARKGGFRINFHGEELCLLNSVEMGAMNFNARLSPIWKKYPMKVLKLWRNQNLLV